MPATAERYKTSAEEPAHGPSIFFDPSALALLAGDATVLTRFLQFVNRVVLEEHIPANKIEVRGSADPEDDTSQLLVRVWTRGYSDSDIRRCHHDLGDRIDTWAELLSEAHKQYFFSRISYQVRRETDV